MTASDQQVMRRRVFYIPGYDPIHPRRYRELYRSEIAKQGEISDYEAVVSASTVSGAYGWNVDMEIDDLAVEAEVEVLVWSDLVRSSMEGSIASTYLQMVRTCWTYISTGAFRRLMWLRKGPVIAALYPVFMLIFQLLAALIVGMGLGWLTTYGLTWLFKGFAFLLTQLGMGAGTELSDYYIFAFVMHVAKLAVSLMAPLEEGAARG